MPTVDLACPRETVEAVLAVLAERRRQDERWGLATLRGYSVARWLAVVAEEVGELSREVSVRGASEDWYKMLEYLARAEEHARLALAGPDPDLVQSDYRHLRAELVQVAAVALAMLEALDGGAPAGHKESAGPAAADPLGSPR